MNKSELKDLVKKYFDLTEKENITENIEEQKETFAVAHLADGTEITNKKPAEFAVGDALFVVTEEGELQAPSGEHTTDSGIVITVSDEGLITGIHRPDEAGEGSLEEMSTEEVAEETEKTEMAEHGDEEEVMEEEEVSEVAMEDDVKEAIISAIAEVVAPELEALKAKLAEHEEKMGEVEEKMKEHYSKESAAPSVTQSKFSKNKPEVWEYTPKNPKQLHYDAVMARLNK